MTSADRIAFGPFSLDVEQGHLWLDGEERVLRPQAFRALQVLVAHSGSHLTYKQLMERAWEGIWVTKHTVIVTVGEVKRALGEYGKWIECHPRLGYRLKVPESQEALRTGWHHLQRHTKEGLEKALVCFAQAVEQPGSEARAREGMARAYLLLGANGMRRPQEAYSGFLEEHRKAVALRGLTPEMRLDRAMGLHIFDRNFAGAEADFLEVNRTQPQWSSGYVHLAMLYVSWQRLDLAEATIQKARTADALDPSLPVAEVLVRFCRRDFEAAASYGRQVLELHPYLQAARVFYASALEYMGRTEEALAQYKQVCANNPVSWHRAMEAACMAKAGRVRVAEKVLQQLRQLQATEYVDGYHLALLLTALGREDEAFAELERARQECCPALCMLDADPKMDGLREDGRFDELTGRLFHGAGLSLTA